MQKNDVALLQKSNNHVTLDNKGVYVDDSELERQERHLMALLQQIRRLRGLPPIMTGAMQRRIVRNGK